MARAICSVPMTISGGRQLGRMCFNMMRQSGMSRQRAASTYSRRRSTWLAARGARVVGPFQDHQRQHHVAHAPAQVGQDHHGHQDGREGQDQVHQPHDQRVGLAAGIGGQQAQQRADHAGDQRRAHAHHQADAQAVENARQQVAAPGRRCRASSGRCPGRSCCPASGARPARRSAAGHRDSCGAIQGASAAARISSNDTTRPTTAVLDDRNSARLRRQGIRGAGRASG